MGRAGRGGLGGDDEDATRRAAAPIVARAAHEHLAHGRPIAAVVAQAGAVADFALWRRAHDWYAAEAQALVDRVLGTEQGSRQLSLLDG